MYSVLGNNPEIGVFLRSPEIFNFTGSNNFSVSTISITNPSKSSRVAVQDKSKLFGVTLVMDKLSTSGLFSEQGKM